MTPDGMTTGERMGTQDLAGNTERQRSDELTQGYGQIAWLWAMSEMHREWPSGYMAKMVLPPVSVGQYHVIFDNGFPAAYCSWAFLSRKIERRLIIDPATLEPDDWTSGDRLWFIDWISPFARRHTWALRSAMKTRFSKQFARSIRVKPHRLDARVASYAGPALTRQDGAALRRHFFEDAKSYFTKG